MIRSFLAITPSTQVLDEIEELQTDLRATGADVRWVGRPSMHLTIQFLGDVPERELTGIEQALAESLRDQDPIEVECRGVGVFPNLKKPRVLWVGLRSDGLVALVERAERALAPLGFPPADRDLRPHITVGRVRSATGWEPLATLVRASAARDLGVSRVEQAVLYRSDLRPTGSVYTALGCYPFRG